jgi:hypothetical protein
MIFNGFKLQSSIKYEIQKPGNTGGRQTGNFGQKEQIFQNIRKSLDFAICHRMKNSGASDLPFDSCNQLFY